MIKSASRTNGVRRRHLPRSVVAWLPAVACLFVVGPTILHAQATATPPTTAPAERAPTPSARELAVEALKLFDAAQYTKAYQLAQQALSVRPDQPEALLVTGLILIHSGRNREAIEPLAQYNKSDVGRNDYRGYEALGDLYMRSSAHRMAHDQFFIAVSKAPITVGDKPTRALIRMKLAQALVGMGRFDDAIKNAEDASQSAPRSATVLWDLARIYSRAEQDEKAVPLMESAARLAREELFSAQFKQSLADDLQVVREKLTLLSDVHKAIVTSRRNLIQKDRSVDPEKYLALARAMSEQAEISRLQSLNDAMIVCVEVMRAAPKSVDAVILLAELQRQSGMTAAATRTYQMALQLAPNDTRILDALRAIGAPTTLPTTAPTTVPATVRNQ